MIALFTGSIAAVLVQAVSSESPRPAFLAFSSRQLRRIQDRQQVLVRQTNVNQDGSLEGPWKIAFGDPSDEKKEPKEEHLIHGAAEIFEESDKDLFEAEMAAAVDAHDCDDSGMEAAMMERAVMMASAMAHKKKQQALHQRDPCDDDSKEQEWNEKHLAHGAAEIHEDTDEEILESEMAAALDAHDCDDPGMEAAMMERAVMMASEMAHKKKEEAERHGEQK
jgi:hypothetical protein